MKQENKAVVYRIDGKRIVLDHRPTLSEAQNIVEGYVEFIKATSAYTGQSVILVVNELGKPRHLPINIAITGEYGASVGGFYIVGNVIVLRGWRTLAK